MGIGKIGTGDIVVCFKIRHATLGTRSRAPTFGLMTPIHIITVLKGSHVLLQFGSNMIGLVTSTSMYLDIGCYFEVRIKKGDNNLDI